MKSVNILLLAFVLYFISGICLGVCGAMTPDDSKAAASAAPSDKAAPAAAPASEQSKKTAKWCGYCGVGIHLVGSIVMLYWAYHVSVAVDKAAPRKLASP